MQHIASRRNTINDMQDPKPALPPKAQSLLDKRKRTGRSLAVRAMDRHRSAAEVESESVEGKYNVQSPLLS